MLYLFGRGGGSDGNAGGSSVNEGLGKVRRVIEGHCEEYEFKCFTSLVGGDGVIWL